MPTMQMGASPSPTLISFRVMALTLAKEDPF